MNVVSMIKFNFKIHLMIIMIRILVFIVLKIFRKSVIPSTCNMLLVMNETSFVDSLKGCHITNCESLDGLCTQQRLIMNVSYGSYFYKSTSSLWNSWLQYYKHDLTQFNCLQKTSGVQCYDNLHLNSYSVLFQNILNRWIT